MTAVLIKRGNLDAEIDVQRGKTRSAVRRQGEAPSARQGGRF